MTSSAAGGDELTPVKRALLEIRDLRARLDLAESASREPIAIIGAALRFPGSINDLDGLWELLSDGREAIAEIPRERWDLDALYDADPDAPGKMFTRRGGFLDGVDGFDAEFFGISPREAESMDPQQRMILETAWRAFEDAGISPSSLHESKTGVFLGVCNNDYGRMIFAHPDRIDPYFSPGNSPSVVAGRLSYCLGLQGPSIAIDTACSSSLVALHLAAQSLRAGESDFAIAGGINLILSPELNINFSKARMMAPDGRCKAFDASADGYVRSEGCGVVVLRRLRDCTSGDRVLAVVRGSAVNQDGRSGGLTAPNGPSQEAVVRAALAAASVEPGQIGYVEAHGTGTALGDPIEVQALGAALGSGRDASRPLAIGSIKTNLGHLEAAAGIAGVFKVILGLQHREIPPHLHLQTLNPLIDWNSLPIVVPTKRTPWAPIEGRLLAGVSSFGFSGTNAHVILEAPPEAVGEISNVRERPVNVLALSARNANALTTLATRFAAYLGNSSAPVADICFTANTGRAQFAHRITVRGTSSAALKAALTASLEGRAARGLIAGAAGAPPRVAFLFTGGGAQAAGMARALYESAPVFRQALDECARILDPMIGRSLLEVLNAPGDLDAPINQTRFGQPALVAVEIALAALWRSWGVEPEAVLGHSLGEYAAAHIAGVLSLEDALKIVVERTRLVDTLPNDGGMATVLAAPDEVEQVLRNLGVSATIAAYNGPGQVVVSGTGAAIAAVAAAFEMKGVRVNVLRVAYASHSAQMDPVLEPFERALDGIKFAEPRLTIISNLTGGTAGLDVIGRPSYWRNHLRQPVRFAQSVQALAALGITHFVEIGPHPVLVGMGAECVAPGVGRWLPSLRRKEDDWDVILDTLQELFVDGARIEWAGLDSGLRRHRVALPTYPFQHRRHWADWATRVDSSGDSGSQWRSVTAAIVLQAERGPIDLNLSGYDARWASLERLALAQVTALLRGRRIFGATGDRATATQVHERLAALPMYRDLVGRWLARLTAAGTLRADGEEFVSDRPLPELGLDALWADAGKLLADDQPLLAYVRHCGSLLDSVIAGRVKPIETLFPKGSFELVEGLYERSPTIRYANGLAAAAVGAIAAGRGSTAPIRILEVGTGSGGTMASILPVLPRAGTAYTCTDVAPPFLDRARKRFAGFPFVRFAELDLERDPNEQGFGAASFDVIVASNTVLATRDAGSTLARFHGLLAPRGILILVETTIHHAWLDVTMGLLDGWQNASDPLRSGNVVLSPDAWIDALRTAGFADAVSSPPQGSSAAILGQHVIVAQAADRANDTASATLRDRSASETPAEEALPLADRLRDAVGAEREDLMVDFVLGHVMSVLKLDASDAPGSQHRLMDLGFDSLMAVQLRNRLGGGLSLERALPVSLLFDFPTIDAISRYLLTFVFPGEAAPTLAPISAPASQAAANIASVAALSDAEIERVLLERLGGGAPGGAR